VAVTLTGLFVYPVKSARGIALEEATLTDRGLRHDRRFMVVDADGRFVTQREEPALARLETALGRDTLTLALAGVVSCAVPRAPARRETRRVRVFTDDVDACDAGPEVAAFLTEALGRSLSLVYMPDRSHRRVDPKRAAETDIVSFADGFPYLLASESSLAALNESLHEPVTMARFRPNFVIAGTPAYAEDGFDALSVGGVPFRALKPCSRCVIVNTDQETGERGRGPLEALVRTHLVGNKAIFGQNLVARGAGTVRIGAEVTFPTQA